MSVGLFATWTGQGFPIDRGQQVFRPQACLFGRASRRYRQHVQSLDRAVGPVTQAYAQARALRAFLQGQDFLAEHVGELLFGQCALMRVRLKPRGGKHQCQQWRQCKNSHDSLLLYSLFGTLEIGVNETGLRRLGAAQIKKVFHQQGPLLQQPAGNGLVAGIERGRYQPFVQQRDLVFQFRGQPE